MKSVLTIGLTGGIGAGKSTVAALLAERGALIVDADCIARQVVEPDQPAYRAIVDRFGPTVVRVDGHLDRAALASVVFSDPGALAALNAITHPAIAAVMAGRLAEAVDTGRVVVLDIPLLTGAMRSAYGMAGVIVVDAPVDVAVGRLAARGIDQADARARVGAQPSREERRLLADFVVDNRGSRSDLAAEVARAWEWITALDDAGA